VLGHALVMAAFSWLVKSISVIVGLLMFCDNFEI
jgi:hypothetical protein